MNNNYNSNSTYLPQLSPSYPQNNNLPYNNNIDSYQMKLSPRSRNNFPRNRSTLNINRYANSYNIERNSNLSNYSFGYGTRCKEVLKGYTPQINKHIMHRSPSYSSNEYMNDETFDVREYQKRIKQREQELMQRYQSGAYSNNSYNHNQLIRGDNGNMYINYINNRVIEPTRYVSPIVMHNSRKNLVSVNPCKLYIILCDL